MQSSVLGFALVRVLRRSLASVSALLFGAAFLFLAGGINGLVLPLRGAAEGMDAVWLGLLGTGWAVGYVVGCVRVPALVARVGHVRSFGVMAALASLSVLSSLLMVHALVWVLLRAVSGFAFAGAAMIVESWLVESAPAEQRGRVFGFYTMTVLIAGTVGQLALATGDSLAPTFFVLAAIFYSLALIPTAVSRSSPKPLLQAHLDIKGLWRGSPLALAGALLIGMSNASFGTLSAVYASAINLPLTIVTLFVALPALAGALVQLPIGLLSDRFDRRLVLGAVALLALAVDAWFVMTPPTDSATALLMVACFGATVLVMYPVVVAHANDHAPPDSAIRTSGGLLLVFGAGSIVGPLAAGGLMQFAGPSGLFITTMAAHVALVGYTAWRITRRAAVDEDTKEQFAVIATPAAGATPQSLPFRVASEEALDDAQELDIVSMPNTIAGPQDAANDGNMRSSVAG